MDITVTGAQFNIGPLRHIQKQRLMVMIRFLIFVFVLLSAAVSVSAAVDGGQEVLPHSLNVSGAKVHHGVYSHLSIHVFHVPAGKHS